VPILILTQQYNPYRPSKGLIYQLSLCTAHPDMHITPGCSRLLKRNALVLHAPGFEPPPAACTCTAAHCHRRV